MGVIEKKIRALRRLGVSGVYNRMMYQMITRERRASFGPLHPDKTFYVIRGVDHHEKHYKSVAMNLLANYSYVLSHMMYAQKRGWLPIVDQIHDPVNTKEDYPINGTDNPWEYFWEQPISYRLSEIYQSKNVVLSKRSWYLQWDLGYSAQKHTDKATIQSYHALSQQIPLNQSTADHVSECYRSLFPNHKRILGVSMRRGGHAKEDEYHAPNHPIQASPHEMIDIVRERMSQWDIDLVFLATEEQQYIDFFKNELKDRLIFMPRRRYNGWKKYNESENPLYQPGCRYQTALEYLTEMELLSRCHCLIGSITSGLRYAIIQNNLQYDEVQIIENGFWSS